MKNLLFTLLLCVCVGTLAQGQTWQELNNGGKKAYQAGNYENAIETLERAKV